MKKKTFYLVTLIILILLSIYTTYKVNNKTFQVHRFDIPSQNLNISDITIVNDNHKITFLDNYTIKKVNEADAIDKIYLNISYKDKSIIDMSLSQPFEGRNIMNVDDVNSIEKLRISEDVPINIKLTYTCNGIVCEDYINLRFKDMKKL